MIFNTFGIFKNSVQQIPEEVLKLEFASDSNLPRGLTSLGYLPDWNIIFKSDFTQIHVVDFTVYLWGNGSIVEFPETVLKGSDIISIRDSGIGVMVLSEGSLSLCSDLQYVSFPWVIYIRDDTFAGCYLLNRVNIPSCEYLGSSTENNNVFTDIIGNEIDLTIPSALMTCHDKGPDKDITYLTSNNTVTITTI
jgi:hypothetical protein